MQITIEPKEIAEIIELLAHRDSAKWKDGINKLGKFTDENFSHVQECFDTIEKWFRYLDGKFISTVNTADSKSTVRAAESR